MTSLFTALPPLIVIEGLHLTNSFTTSVHLIPCKIYKLLRLNSLNKSLEIISLKLAILMARTINTVGSSQPYNSSL